MIYADRLWGLLRRKEDRPRAAEILAFILPLLAWYGFAWVYYGSPLPHSITAKMAAYRLEPSAAFIRLLQHYAVPFTGSSWIGPVGIALGLVLYPVFSLLGARPAIKQHAGNLASGRVSLALFDRFFRTKPVDFPLVPDTPASNVHLLHPDRY